MNIHMIPLNQLVPSSSNVRKTGGNVGIEELAASIAAHGLLQNLQVKDSPKGKFEVVAGGRRFAALKLLVKQKKLAKDAKIPCHVLDTEDAGEISLAENTLRLPMHPADQFAAFYALAESGKGIEDIAARFGTSAAVVRQRLKLAGVSPTLIDLYRSDEMTLEQLMVFTVSDDHAGQEAAWFGQPDWQRSATNIRRALTAAHVDANDRRVRFIGLETYRAAGGGLVRDLFQPDHEGYLTDPAVLERLVAERLEAEASAVRAEGWKWIEIVPRLDYGVLQGFGRVRPERMPLSAEQQDELDRLTAEYEALIEEHGEDPEPEIAEQLDTLSEKIDTLAEGASQWQPADIGVAGAIVSVDHDGSVQIERGLLRAEDRPARRAVGSGQADAGNSPDVTPDPSAKLSARLIEDLTAERTAALRATMQDNESVALAALAHALALPIFYPHSFKAESCVDLRLVSRDLRGTEGMAESGAATLLGVRHAAWEQNLPAEAADLFGWLLRQESATVTRLISFCAAMSVDAVRGKQDRADCPRLAHADQLATSLGLDMAVWWEPTPNRYLGRVPKPLILEAVAEAVSSSAADNLGTMKRADLVIRAGERLAGKGWLPPILRSPVAANSNDEPMPIAAE